MQSLNDEYIYKLKILIFGPKCTTSWPSLRQKHSHLHLSQQSSTLISPPQRRSQLQHQKARVSSQQQNLWVQTPHVVSSYQYHQQ